MHILHVIFVSIYYYIVVEVEILFFFALNHINRLICAFVAQDCALYFYYQFFYMYILFLELLTCMTYNVRMNRIYISH